MVQASRFKEAASPPPLSTADRHIYLTKRANFEKYLRAGPALGIVFFGFVLNRLETAQVAFKLQETNQSIELFAAEMHAVREEPYYRFSGPGNTEFMQSMTEEQATRDPVMTASNFIRFSAARSPETVGEPIELVQVTRNGARWNKRLGS